MDEHLTLLAALVRGSERSYAEIVDGYHACARANDEKVAITVRTLRRWMTGDVRTNPRPAQRRVARLYWGYPMNELLGPFPSDDEHRRVGGPDRSDGHDAVFPVTQALPLPGSPDGVRSAMWEEIVAQQSADFAMRARRAAMDPMVLESLELELRRMSWEYLYSPRPRALFDELVAVRDHTFRQIESERPRPDQMRQLYSLAGVACALLAQSTHELGYRRAAMSHAHAAFVCAELAGNVSLQVWIRATQAAIAEYAGLPREAVRYAEAGRQLPSTGTAVVRLMSLAANGHARLGDKRAAQEALAAAQRAREAVTSGDSLDELGGVFSVSLAKQHAYAASAFALLGQGTAAAEEATRALELYSAAPLEQRQPVNEAYAYIDVAYARLLAGEIDGVGDTLIPVLNLPMHARVDLLGEKLRRLHRQLSEGAQGQSRAARELKGQIEGFVTTLTLAELS